jgi:hypothetical protein
MRESGWDTTPHRRRPWCSDGPTGRGMGTRSLLPSGGPPLTLIAYRAFRPSGAQASLVAGSRSRDEINSSDPPLPAVCTAYPTPPLLPFLHPPVELAGVRPRGHIDRYWRIDLATVRCGELLQIVVAEVHI